MKMYCVRAVSLSAKGAKTCWKKTEGEVLGEKPSFNFL